MSKSGKFTAEELLAMELEGSKPLIEGFLYEMDNALLIGKEKANKSTLELQMSCALSSGQSLFGEYKVTSPIDVVIVQAEGKLHGTKQNLTNMMKAVDCDPSKILILYYPAIQLNRPEGLKKIIDDIDTWRKPRVIFVDPLYQSMVGKIEDQEESSRMTGNLRVLADRYEAAIVLVHHAHRIKRTPTGEIIDEGDDAVFGSFVWKAWPDTVLLIQKVQGHRNHRKLSCDTSRTAKIVETLDLELIEPEPFYLKPRDSHPIDEIVYGKLGDDALTIDELIVSTKRSRLHIAEALVRLKSTGRARITNFGHKPQLWAIGKSHAR